MRTVIGGGQKSQWSFARRFRFFASVTLVIAGFAAKGACRRSASKPDVVAEPVAEPVVARVGDAAITVATLAELLAKQPAAQVDTLSGRRSLLDNQIRLELMAQEARRRGYDRDPAFERAVKQQLISTLLRREVEERVKPEHIPEAEVEKYYKEHAAEFTEPFAAVRGDIRQRLYHRERGRRVDELLASIKQRTPVEVNEAELMKLVAAPAPAPAAPAPAP